MLAGLSFQYGLSLYGLAGRRFLFPSSPDPDESSICLWPDQLPTIQGSGYSVVSVLWPMRIWPILPDVPGEPSGAFQPLSS